MREAGAINKPHERRQKEKMTAARSETFPSASNPQRASSGQAINQQRSYSFPSCPTHLDQGANAGDASLQALGELLVKIQPSLSSLLQDLANWDAARSLSAPNFDKPQETSSLANTSQEEQEQIVSEEPIPTDLTRSETFPSASHPQRFSPGEAINQQKISSFPSFPTHLDQGASSSLNAGTSQGGSVEIDVEEPSPSEDFEYQTNGRKRTLDEYCALCVPLLEAVIKGDWLAAEAFFRKHPDCVRAPITKEQGTALHNAVLTQRTTFIKELLKWMNPKDLELQNNYGFTALHSAAQSGIVRNAEMLVKFNNRPLLIHDCNGDTPLIVAVYHEHRNMVEYLFGMTPLQELTTDELIELLHRTIYYDSYDIALKILELYPAIATDDTTCGWRALEELAKKPSIIGSESQLSFWKRGLNSCFKGIFNKDLRKTLAHRLVEDLWKKVATQDKSFSSNLVHYQKTLLFEAAKVGNVEFLVILMRANSSLVYLQDKNNITLFHIAILYRQESVLNLIYEIGIDKYRLTSLVTLNTRENMLHLVARLPPSDRLNNVAGALSVQRELMWFKEVKKIVPSSYMNMKNAEGQTPTEVFIENHSDFQGDAENWMKVTANNCMVVATLIATVVFAAAFTVPGGNNQTGTPIFLLRSNWFMVFFISDAIAMCSSTTSILIFLSLFVSRYTEDDFYESVPLKLLLGLVTLFISITGMMVAFSATCFLAVYDARAWAAVFVIILAIIPITSFVVLHRELWVDTILSVLKSRFIFRPHKHRF